MANETTETRELQNNIEVTFRGKVDIGNYDLKRLAERNSMSLDAFLTAVKNNFIPIQYELTDNILIDEVWEVEEAKLSIEESIGNVKEYDLPTSGL